MLFIQNFQKKSDLHIITDFSLTFMWKPYWLRN